MPRFAIISDIHANWEALAEVLRDISSRKISNVVCLGDIVGYGPDPKACIDLVRENCLTVVMGNHEVFSTMPNSLDRFHRAVREPIELAKKELDPDDINWIRRLPVTEMVDDFTIVHASLYHPVMFLHMHSDSDAKDHFKNQSSKVCFLGHTHIPAIFERSDGDAIGLINIKQGVALEPAKKYAINAGSVGQPRDGDCRACYVEFDTTEQEVQFHRVEYDWEKTKAKLKEKGFSRSLGDRLERGC
ncbi:MAG: metallophosphoesterase family protein [Verrucomicrobiales bacterium]|nr:metallophosphoesterase family protein [Verrucomicrobiales bacterium]